MEERLQRLSVSPQPIMSVNHLSGLAQSAHLPWKRLVSRDTDIPLPATIAATNIRGQELVFSIQRREFSSICGYLDSQRDTSSGQHGQGLPWQLSGSGCFHLRLKKDDWPWLRSGGVVQTPAGSLMATRMGVAQTAEGC